MLIHKRILELIKGVEIYIFIKSFFGILIILSHILQAVVLGQLIAGLYRRYSFNEVKTDIFFLLTLIFLRIFLTWLSNVYGKWIVGRVKNKLRKRAYEKLLKLGAGYITKTRTGFLESTIVAGIDYLEAYLTLYIPQILVCFVGSGAMIIYVFLIDYFLGFLVLLTAVISLFVPVLFLKVLSKYTEDHWDSYLNLNAKFVDNAQGILTLKAFNAGEREGNILKEKMKILFQNTMRSLSVNLLEVGISNFSVSLGSAFTLGLSSYFAVIGRISLSELTILLFLTTEVYRPISELAYYFHQGFMGMTSTEGLLKLFDEKELIKDVENTDYDYFLDNKPPKIEFKNVSFSYNKVEEVFEDLSLKVNSAQKLALVGSSGSGKTTIAKLIMRFYDIDKGSILFNGIDIRQIPLKEFRKQISLVSQDTYLFSGTIEDNLRLAKEDADMEDLIKSAKAANIHDFIISLPDGYNTELGERGLNLSGGQRQRISIARALLKNSPLIILDEATSSVDLKNEQEIQKSLDKLLKNRTAIIIAHRLSTIKNADMILVLSDGKIVERGTHETLMTNKKHYYNLVLAQNEGV